VDCRSMEEPRQVVEEYNGGGAQPIEGGRWRPATARISVNRRQDGAFRPPLPLPGRGMLVLGDMGEQSVVPLSSSRKEGKGRERELSDTPTCLPDTEDTVRRAVGRVRCRVVVGSTTSDRRQTSLCQQPIKPLQRVQDLPQRR